MAESGGLLNRCTPERGYRGFESLPLRVSFLAPGGIRREGPSPNGCHATHESVATTEATGGHRSPGDRWSTAGT